MTGKRVQMNVEPIAAELKGAVQAEAERRGISASDAAVEKLAAAFSVEFEAAPSTKVVPRHEPNPHRLVLMMPPELRRKIKTRAAQREVSPSALMRATLLEAFDCIPDAA